LRSSGSIVSVVSITIEHFPNENFLRLVVV
jgi:hypothetical protein